MASVGVVGEARRAGPMNCLMIPTACLWAKQSDDGGCTLKSLVPPKAGCSPVSPVPWPHADLFPTFNIYIDQFRIFKNMVEDTLIYCSEDKELAKLAKEAIKCKVVPYSTPEHKIKEGIKDE